MPLLSVDNLLQSARGLIRDLAWGDLQLRLQSLAQPGALPTIFCARAMRGHIQWHAISKETGWFLFIPVASNDWTVAEFHVNVCLEPDSTVDPAEHTRGIATFVPPPFILTQETEFATIQLHDGRRMQLRVQNDKAQIGLDGDWISVDGNPRAREKAAFLELLQVVFSWARDDRTPVPRPYDQLTAPGTGSGPAIFLYDVVLHFRNLARSFEAWAANPEMKRIGEPDPGWTHAMEQLRAVHPDLAAGYRLDQCTLTMRVWLDERGEIAKEKEQSLKLDLSVELLKQPGVHEVRINALPPDVVARGPLHQGFLACLRARTPNFRTTADLAGALGDTVMRSEWGGSLRGFDVSEIENFVRSNEQEENAVMARIGREAGGKDVELIFLKGTLKGHLTWMIFRLYVDVDHRQNVQSRLKDAQFLACFYDGILYRRADPFDSRISGYVSALVRALVSWHPIIQQGRQP